MDTGILDQSAGRRMMRRAAPIFLPAALVLTLASAAAYGVGQNLLRTGADDPQVQLADDTARALAGGAAAESVIPGNQVDVAVSLALHLGVYDDAGRPLLSTARLHGEIPVPPLGVFVAARARPDVLTWQPENGVRIAAVVQHYGGPRGAGFVIAGRSLRLVEQRERQMEMLLLVGWIAGLILLAGLCLLLRWPRSQGTRAAIPGEPRPPWQ